MGTNSQFLHLEIPAILSILYISVDADAYKSSNYTG